MPIKQDRNSTLGKFVEEQENLKEPQKTIRQNYINKLSEIQLKWDINPFSLIQKQESKIPQSDTDIEPRIVYEFNQLYDKRHGYKHVIDSIIKMRDINVINKELKSRDSKPYSNPDGMIKFFRFINRVYELIPEKYKNPVTDYINNEKIQKMGVKELSKAEENMTKMETLWFYINSVNLPDYNRTKLLDFLNPKHFNDLRNIVSAANRIQNNEKIEDITQIIQSLSLPSTLQPSKEKYQQTLIKNEEALMNNQKILDEFNTSSTNDVAEYLDLCRKYTEDLVLEPGINYEIVSELNKLYEMSERYGYGNGISGAIITMRDAHSDSRYPSEGQPGKPYANPYRIDQFFEIIQRTYEYIPETFREEVTNDINNRKIREMEVNELSKAEKFMSKIETLWTYVNSKNIAKDSHQDLRDSDKNLADLLNPKNFDKLRNIVSAANCIENCEEPEGSEQIMQSLSLPLQLRPSDEKYIQVLTNSKKIGPGSRGDKAPLSIKHFLDICKGCTKGLVK